jgi:hypothetical protein
VPGLNDCALTIKDCQLLTMMCSNRVKYWEIIARNIKKRGWSLGYVPAIDSNRHTIWIADAHRDDGKRFVVHADEKLTAFVELEAAIRGCGFSRLDNLTRFFPDSAAVTGFESGGGHSPH